MPRNSAEYTLNTLDTVPASVSKTGTIAIKINSHYVEGTGTEFKSDKTIAEGDWIFAGGAIGKIERIISDTLIYLEDPFSPAIAPGTNLFITKASRAREISVINIGGVATTINGVTFSADVAKTYGEIEWYKGSQRDYPDPLIVDGSISDVEVIIIY